MSRVLHVVNHSLPHADGYCVRTAQIVRVQREIGIDPVVVTSPRQEPEPTEAVESFDDVPHFRTFPLHKASPARRIPFVREWKESRLLTRRILEVIDECRPDTVHAHTPCLWGQAALKAARHRQLPFVYELRGFWEDCMIDNGVNPKWSMKHRLSRALETHVVKNADAVVTISQTLRDELASRRLSGEKMFLVPNGVDVERFSPLPVDTDLQQELGLNGHACLGYLGSFYNWEGIDDLVRAMADLVKVTPQARLLLVGGGNEHGRIERLIDELSLGDCVRLIGPVARDDVPRYYSVMDVLVYPRKRSRTTELTTPLKPLEAMCMAKPIIASDVGGLRELFSESVHGIRFVEPENVEELSKACEELVRADAATRSKMGESVRQHVLEARNWRRIVRIYRSVYESASFVTPAGSRNESVEEMRTRSRRVEPTSTRTR